MMVKCKSEKFLFFVSGEVYGVPIDKKIKKLKKIIMVI